MAEALCEFLVRETAEARVAGVIGIGGSGGTAIITKAMQALPIGLPKLMVSTVASGNVAPYVGCSDIALMYSVVDVAGLNAVSCRVLANAAHAMAGMAAQPPPALTAKPALGMTMFGVTTPCVTAVRKILEDAGFDCLVFHATGAGGRAMEKLVESGLIVGVLDITTTEVADEIVGGIFPAGPARLEAIVRRGIPYCVSVGALDMVNFAARSTVPPQFAERKLHVHNPQITLLRTTQEENCAAARWIAAKLQAATSPISILIPERGVSALDAEGQPFYDPAADEALFCELETAVQTNEHVHVTRLPLHINDPAFAAALAENFLAAWQARARL